MRNYQSQRNQNSNYSYRFKRRIKTRKTINYNIMEIENLPKALAFRDLLYRYEYLGQYGNIIKIDLFPNSEQTTTVKVSYSNQTETSIAILSLNDFDINGRKLKCKYECLLQREKKYNIKYNLKYKLDEAKTNKEHQLAAIRISDINNKMVQNNIVRQCMNKRTIFPSPLTIYSLNKYFLEENSKKVENSKITNTSNKDKSRYDFVIYNNDNLECNMPQYIYDFIQRKYELTFKNTSSSFDVILLCQIYKKNFLQKKEKDELKENEGLDWFNFLYNDFSEENKNFYNQIYEEEEKNDNYIDKEDDLELVKDFDIISEGILNQVSTEESEFSEN